MPKNKRVALKDIRREEIMQAAVTVFSDRTCSSMTLDDIAKASGFSKGGITYYYSSKEALIKDVFEYYFEGIYKRAKEEIAKKKDPLSKLFSFAWLFDGDDPQTHTLWSLTLDMMAISTHNEEYRSAYQRWIKEWGEMVTPVIDEGVSTGVFQTEDSDEASRVLSATVQGIASRWYLDREHQSSEWAVKSLKSAIINVLNVPSDKVPQK